MTHMPPRFFVSSERKPLTRKPAIMPTAKKSRVPASGALLPGAVRPRPAAKNSQAHPGVSPLAAVSHRNTGFQPLPRPLGLPPYHYSLTDHFPAIGDKMQA